MRKPLKSPWIFDARLVLTQALLVSGALNVGLLSLFFFVMVRERPVVSVDAWMAVKHQEVLQEEDVKLVDTLLALEAMPFELLVSQLKQTRPVENGYTVRDLALGVLLRDHYFDLDRALYSLPKPTQERVLTFAETRKELRVYPGLHEEQYKAIESFASVEKWPLTSEGLFSQMKDRAVSDTSLKEAFFLTPEFMAVELLFVRTVPEPVVKEELLEMLLEGDWSMLETFAAKQKISSEASVAKRQRLLIDYLARSSSTSASILLKTDRSFVEKKLDDATVAALLSLLLEKNEAAEGYALEMLKAPRSDLVRRLAAERLYHFAGEAVPANYSYAKALARFAPNKNELKSVGVAKEPAKPKIAAKVDKPVVKAPAVVAKKEKIHVVQEGDSLWKIAKKYKVDMAALKKRNSIDSDFLKAGMLLYIP